MKAFLQPADDPPGWRARLMPTLLVLGIILMLETARALGWKVFTLTPGAFLILAVAYGSFLAGLRAGLVASLAALLYMAFLYGGRTWPWDWHVTRDDAVRFSALGVLLPGNALLIGLLKRRLIASEQRERRLAEERGRLAVEGAHLGLFSLALPTGAVRANAEFARHLGLDAAALAAGSVPAGDLYAVVHPDDREQARSAVEGTVRGAQADCDVEFRVAVPAGSDTRRVHLVGRAFRGGDGSLERFDGVTLDVSDARRAERALRVAEERFTLAARHAEDGIWEWNPATDTVWWSDRNWELLGLKPGEAEASMDFIRERVHPDDLGELWGQAREHVEGKLPRYAREFRIRHADGSWRWWLTRGTAVRDAAGKVTRMLGAHSDITPFKEQAAVLLRAKETAEAASRTKDEFLATLSHELRTPLSAILAYANVLENDGDDPEARREAVDAIGRNARAQTQLIEDLLDVSRIVSGRLRLDLRPVDLREVIEGALDTVRPAAGARGVKVEARLSPLPTEVRGDADRLRQVMWNVISNAIKFTPPRGRVEVTLGPTPDGAHAQVTVRDTGRGIAPEFLPHLFERFAQADSSSSRPQGGLGLGLAITRHLLEQHGGSIQAASDGAGQGATFTVLLPFVRPLSKTDAVALAAGGKAERMEDGGWQGTGDRAAKPPTGAAAETPLTGSSARPLPSSILHPPSSPPAPPATAPIPLPHILTPGPSEPSGGGFFVTPRLPASTTPAVQSWPADQPPPPRLVRDLEGLKVVVTDDNPDARAVLRRILSRHGATVTLAATPEEAFKAVQRERPDVFLCDIEMPEEDGYSLIGRVRALPPECGGQTPAAALTAYARDEDRARALASGFQVHVPKPVKMEELLSVVAGLARGNKTEGETSGLTRPD